MGRKRTPAALALLHELKTRVTAQKYEELQRILRQNPNNDMSGLLRDILNKQPVKVFTQDQTFNNLMEELSKLRSEIRAIGVNINQITRFFNTYPDRTRKEFYAKTAFAAYVDLQPKIEQLLLIISNLSKKWLSE